jgi:hypothetical protein
MRKAIMWIAAWVGFLVTGCAAPPPRIEAARPATRTVVIADIPDINPVATVQVVSTKQPWPYFSFRFDQFYALEDGAAAPD